MTFNDINTGQDVKFARTAKYKDDFRKGDKGIVERVLTRYPLATHTIYLVRHKATENTVWAVGTDIIPWDQLELAV